MNSSERVRAALNLEEPDRVPLFIIGGVCEEAGYAYDEFCRDPAKIAHANRIFMERYETDVSLIFPDTWFTHEGWGMKIRYFKDYLPVPVEPLIKELEDYGKLEVLDPYKDGRMPMVIKSIETLSREVGDSKVISTIQFAPLSFLAQIRGMVKSMQDLILSPDLVHQALKILSETVIEFFKAASKAGATLLLYHNARLDYSLLTKKQAREFGVRYDSAILKKIGKLGIPVMLHTCGPEPMIDLFISEYPYKSFRGIQWWDRGSNIPLAFAKEAFGDKVCLAAGVDNVKTMLMGKPEDVEREAKEAIAAAGVGGGFILSMGCEISSNTPKENIYAMTNTVRKYGTYPIKL